jgi:hypothetical protein
MWFESAGSGSYYSSLSGPSGENPEGLFLTVLETAQVQDQALVLVSLKKGIIPVQLGGPELDREREERERTENGATFLRALSRLPPFMSTLLNRAALTLSIKARPMPNKLFNFST